MAVSSQQLAKAIAQAAYDSKASDVEIYDLRGNSSVTDFTVLCTATSIPHLRSLLRDVEGKVEETAQSCPVYAERTPAALWAVLDYADVIFHVMTEEIRAHYQLEEFWKSGIKLDWQEQETL